MSETDLSLHNLCNIACQQVASTPDELGFQALDRLEVDAIEMAIGKELERIRSALADGDGNKSASCNVGLCNGGERSDETGTSDSEAESDAETLSDSSLDAVLEYVVSLLNPFPHLCGSSTDVPTGGVRVVQPPPIESSKYIVQALLLYSLNPTFSTGIR